MTDVIVKKENVEAAAKMLRISDSMTGDTLACALEIAFGIYPCPVCGRLRTKDEGGDKFIVCNDCYSKESGLREEIKGGDAV